MSQTVVLRVAMSCEGCSGAVRRVLNKMEGVESFDIDMKEQKVTVRGNVQPDAVFQTVSKTGKKTAFWETEAEPKPAEGETKPAEAVTKPTEPAPTEAETKPIEPAPAEAENKATEPVAAS